MDVSPLGDGLAQGGRDKPFFGFDAKLLGQNIACPAQVQCTLPAQHMRTGFHVVTCGQRSILVHQLADRLGELGVVLVVQGDDGVAEERRQRLVPRRRIDLFRAVNAAGREMIGFYGRKELSGRHLMGGHELVAIGNRNGSERHTAQDVSGAHWRERAQIHRLSHMLAVTRQNAHGTHAIQPRRQLVNARGLVAQRFHQSKDAIAMLSGSDEGRSDGALLEHPRADVVDRVACRHAILDQFFEQPVVILGEVFEERPTGLRFPVREFFGNLDQLRRAAFAILPRALGHQIHRADDHSILSDRDLAQHDRVARITLQCFDDVTSACLRFVHFC